MITGYDNIYDSGEKMEIGKAVRTKDGTDVVVFACGLSVYRALKAAEELEKEGLIRSVAGKGFYVCEYNTDYLKEKQLMMIEKRTQEIIYEAKNAGLSNCSCRQQMSL